MRYIKDVKSHVEGEEIKAHVMYTSTSAPIPVDGRIDIQALGEIRLNGVTIRDTKLKVTLSSVQMITVMPNSAVIFNQAPFVPRRVPKNVPVAEIPDLADAQTLQMNMMFDQWAKQRGLVIPEEPLSELVEDVDLDPAFDDIDDDFDMDFPLDIDEMLPDEPVVEPDQLEVIDEDVPAEIPAEEEPEPEPELPEPDSAK